MHARVLLALCLWLAPPVARAAGPSGGVRLPVKSFRLDNGLTVLVHEDHTVPVVAVQAWYFVGSKDERPGRTGFAHLFEHLMFQGSAHVADDQHLSLVAESGGSANATTSEDRTNFFETLPSSYLELALWLESDRMGFLADALTQDKLDTQRGVVQNERRQVYENRPYGQAAFAINEALYPEGHPYHHLPIGSHADLEAATLDDVKDFFRTWYTPGNAVLAIAGDVEPARARELAVRYFGGLPSHPAPRRPAVPDVVMGEDRRLQLTDRVSLERLYLVWPTPRWFAPGDAELDLVATVLGGRGGRLYPRRVYELGVAQEVAVVQASAKLSSTFQIVVTAKPGHTAAECERAVMEELARLQGPAPVTEAELGRARNQWEALFVYGLEGYEGRAERLNTYFDALGDGAGFERDRSRYLDATIDKVNRSAGLLGGHHLSLTVVPASGAAPAGPVAR
jgi:zinc protease